jgi:hypothetical protein
MNGADLFFLCFFWTVLAVFLMPAICCLGDKEPSTFAGKFYRLLGMAILIALSGPVW